MNDAVGLVALIITMLGIGAMLLPTFVGSFGRHDPYKAAKLYSPWVRRTGLAAAVIGLVILLVA